MLLGLSPLLSPDLLKQLCAMGHSDDVAIVDANFPAASCAQRLVRVDGGDAVEVLAAILTVLPIDTFAEAGAARMAVVDKPNEIPPVCAEFRHKLEIATRSRVCLVSLDRYEFYARAREAYLIVATAERRLYGNIILRKGVVGADGQPVYK